MSDYNIQKVRCKLRGYSRSDIAQESTLHLILRLRGGGPGPVHTLGFGAGGQIEQVIAADPYPPSTWHKEAVVVFNVQLLNAQSFQDVTGFKPPRSPINARTYAAAGLPFFKMIEAGSGISGAFDGVKSVAQLEGRKEDKEYFPLKYLNSFGHATESDSVTINEETKVRRGTAYGDLVNEDGPMSEFRCIKELEEELDSFTFVD